MSRLYNSIYHQVQQQIPFNPNWESQCGYFNHAVEGPHAPKIQTGQIVKSITPSPRCRRILFLGTLLGNVVIFDRFNEGKRGTILVSCSTVVAQLVPALGSELSEDSIRHLLGEWVNGVNHSNFGMVVNDASMKLIDDIQESTMQSMFVHAAEMMKSPPDLSWMDAFRRPPPSKLRVERIT